MAKIKNRMMQIEEEIISELEKESPDLNLEDLGFNTIDEMRDWIECEIRKRF